MFSAVSTTFIIDIHAKLEPDLNEQSVALLRAILLTLNQSAIPGESPTVPYVQGAPPSEIVAVTWLMYASLLISLLAAFIAMLGKQWLNRYMRNVGGSVIERCGDRQRKRDALEKWPFHMFVESLPIMLQVALLLLACGLCRYMMSINASVAGVLIAFTIAGVLFYLGIVIVGTHSYECPFQTPASNTIRRFWGKAGPHITPPLLVISATGTYLYKHLFWLPALTSLRRWWKAIQFRTIHTLLWFPSISIRYHPRSPSLPIVQLDRQEPASWSDTLRRLLENIECTILRIALRLPQIPPLSTIQEGSPIVGDPSLWLTPTALTTLRKTNANDVRCVSWILRTITDPEALDTAIRLAGTIRWFEDGPDVIPPYDLIICTLHACFDPTGNVYPALKDRAYYSARAVLWIHILAMCSSKESANMFPLPTRYTPPSPDHDLTHLLNVYKASSVGLRLRFLLNINPKLTPTHVQWISNVLLHLTWANWTTPGTFDWICRLTHNGDRPTVPLDAMVNRLLAWCLVFGVPVKGEVLMVQDKSCGISYLAFKLLTPLFASGRLKQILSQLSKAIVSTIASPTHRGLLLHALYDLNKFENPPWCLTEMAYEWCSVICENCNIVGSHNEEEPLLLSLEIGFRHLDLQNKQIPINLTHTEHHRRLADIAFGSRGNESIADFLYAWTLGTSSPGGSCLSPDMCARHLVDLHHRVSSSSRLRTLVIRSTGLVGYEGFEQVGVEKLVKLLDHLRVGVGEVDAEGGWARLLLDTVRSPEGVQRLSHQYWELLVEIVIATPPWEGWDVTYSAEVGRSLEEAQGWDNLECWVGVAWMLWSETSTIAEDLERKMLVLFRQRPGVNEKLRQWMKRWSTMHGKGVPQSFQLTCEQVHKKAPQRTP